jgi:hypothetical protein
MSEQWQILREHMLFARGSRTWGPEGQRKGERRNVYVRFLRRYRST